MCYLFKQILYVIRYNDARFDNCFSWFVLWYGYGTLPGNVRIRWPLSFECSSLVRCRGTKGGFYDQTQACKNCF